MTADRARDMSLLLAAIDYVTGEIETGRGTVGVLGHLSHAKHIIYYYFMIV